MTCPFLKEAQVKYCGTSGIRKLIPLAQAARASERCSSSEHTSCAVYCQQASPDPNTEVCPYLHESLMQYCAATAVSKLIPYSESLLSRCGTESHRYCELYLALAHPLLPGEAVDGLAMPRSLSYTPNHMWLDMASDGVAHAGIDAYFSRVLGEIDRITFVWQHGHHRPTAVVTANGVDLEIVFPFGMQITGCNLYLRANPKRLTAEPYTGGWLFEGIPDPDTLDWMMNGEQAGDWMDYEVTRMNEFLQQLPGPAGPTAADGGMFAPGLGSYLDREQMLALFHEFFSPYIRM
jgi:glycine cleavage system H lipoate-binding protein